MRKNIHTWRSNPAGVFRPKLLFFDIDGTLIDEEKKEMPESAKRAIAKARENGHLCVINTGRTWKLVNGVFTGLAEFDGYVLGCGTMIRLHDKTIMWETFSPEMGRRIIEGLRKNRIDAVLEGGENNYHDAPENIHTRLFYDFILPFQEEKFGSYEEAPGHFDKFYAYAEETGAIEAFRKEFEKELDFVDREHGFYEIMPKGFSKASGIRFLAEKLCIPMEDTVAIGDSNNDLSMLACAGVSIAMGNAARAVKDMADYVTTEVGQDGIEHALKWLGVL